MKKTRFVAMLLAVALVISCMSVMVAAAPIAFEYAGQSAELALGDWTGVTQSNPQNKPIVVENGYILISNRTNVYQGFTYTFDYLFEAGVKYTISFDINIVADENLRFYMHDAATDTGASELRGDNTKITSVDNKYRDGKIVPAGDSVVTMSFTPAEDLSGVFTLKMHSAQTPPANNDIKIDNFKITNDSDKPEFARDFNSAKDAAGLAAYVHSNGASAGKPSVSIGGLSEANDGGYLVISNRTTRLQGANYTFDYTFKKDVTYAVSFEMTLLGDNNEERFRIYLHDGTNDSAKEIKRYDPATVSKGKNLVRFEFTAKEDSTGKAFFKFHSNNADPAPAAAFGDVYIDNFTITPSTVSAETPVYKCSFDTAADGNGWNPQGSGHKVALAGVPNYVAGNGYVHVGNRKAGVSGAEYVSGKTLTAGEAYTLTLRIRISNPEEKLRIMGSTGGSTNDLDKSQTLGKEWANWTIPFTATNSASLNLKIHSAAYQNGLSEFDIDSLVITDSTGAKVIEETYDSSIGAWVEYKNSGHTSNPGATISHATEGDYATTIGNEAIYTPADDMALSAGIYAVSGTFKVPFDRARLVVARDEMTTGASFIDGYDYNKINLGVEITDVDGNKYYAEENSVPVTSEWQRVVFKIEIPDDMLVKEIKFFGKDGVVPVAGEYDFGGDKVVIDSVNKIYNDDASDDNLTGYPTLVQIPDGNGGYKDYKTTCGAYSALVGNNGFLASADIPFMFYDAKLSALEIEAKTTEAGSAGILAMLLLRRKAAATAGDEIVDGGEGNVTDEPVVAGDKYYLHVETTAYPQGVEFVTEDSAYTLDESKEYVLEIKMRSAAAVSYYRAYCGAGAPSKLSGDYEIKPEGFSGSGFPVAGADWVVVTADLRNVVGGQLGIKIHGGVDSGVAYGDSFDVDYIKITEKLTGNTFFYEDFEDEEFNCTYNAINGAVGAAVKGE